MFVFGLLRKSAGNEYRRETLLSMRDFRQGFMCTWERLVSAYLPSGIMTQRPSPVPAASQPGRDEGQAPQRSGSLAGGAHVCRCGYKASGRKHWFGRCCSVCFFKFACRMIYRFLHAKKSTVVARVQLQIYHTYYDMKLVPH